jgi:hypothetical protein
VALGVRGLDGGKSGLRHHLPTKNPPVGLPLAGRREDVLSGPCGTAGQGESVQHAGHRVVRRLRNVT